MDSAARGGGAGQDWVLVGYEVGIIVIFNSPSFSDIQVQRRYILHTRPLLGSSSRVLYEKRDVILPRGGGCEIIGLQAEIEVEIRYQNRKALLDGLIEMIAHRRWEKPSRSSVCVDVDDSSHGRREGQSYVELRYNLSMESRGANTPRENFVG